MRHATVEERVVGRPWKDVGVTMDKNTLDDSKSQHRHAQKLDLQTLEEPVNDEVVQIVSCLKRSQTEC